jgi:hypothetical protein
MEFTRSQRKTTLRPSPPTQKPKDKYDYKGDELIDFMKRNSPDKTPRTINTPKRAERVTIKSHRKPGPRKGGKTKKSKKSKRKTKKRVSKRRKTYRR